MKNKSNIVVIIAIVSFYLVYRALNSFNAALTNMVFPLLTVLSFFLTPMPFIFFLISFALSLFFAPNFNPPNKLKTSVPE